MLTYYSYRRQTIIMNISSPGHISAFAQRLLKEKVEEKISARLEVTYKIDSN